MRRRNLALAALCAAALLASGGLLWRAMAPAPAAPPSPPATTTLPGGGDAEGFERATAPRPFRFPEDHGPHPGFRHEWWYFTGNLRTPEGRRFGYQLTFFRFALAPPGGTARESRWAATQAYMAHFTVTDVKGNRFRFFERTGRGALDLAGATAKPFRVWIGDWSANGGKASLLPVRLRAEERGVSIDLLLDSGAPVVPQGDRGLSRKSAEPGNASYYYSMTRLATRGSVQLGGIPFPVEGTSWLDREWGTSALGEEQSGWDWFALQLSDGSDLMFYRLRRKDGQPDPFSAGMLLLPDGSRKVLSPEGVRIDALDFWKSPESGARYPSRWRLRLPSEGLELEIAPRVADQELRTSVRYWEGAVSVKGTARGNPVGGEGYVELTGYGGTTGR
jgi:predicted secreted hydrolase